MTEGNMRKSDGKKCNSVTTCRSPTATSEVEARRRARDLSICRVRKNTSYRNADEMTLHKRYDE